jgi:quinoprotein glucose dehydrogenase
MRLMHLTLIAGMILVGPALVLATAQDNPRTTWDGVYTDAQAKRGETQYSQSCSTCHSPDLSGGDSAPSLTGADFNAAWNDLSIGELADRVRTTMPADGPGSLSRQQYVDILTFLLARDGFPAGQTELPTTDDALKLIKIVTKKP